MPPQVLICDIPEVPEIVTAHLVARGIHTVGQLLDAAVRGGVALNSVTVGEVVWVASDYKLNWRECVCVYNLLRIARKPMPVKGGAA
ncbi:hypothetical protein [Limnoglobus roseus]|uniref:Uncharacterized protein n=1 Tax=Limnoglobus roseus TaxID=2598579 RepID=A0A5C1AMS5_9BACT|nr:hypothetical protein [Limnoglobus roseus]QEL18504.1 hypothetical protein PX52LOC_05530 [Limnoglobus roseus]